MRDRLAYLHIPKAGGTSLGHALTAHFDSADSVPYVFDTSLFGDFARIEEIPQRVFLGEADDLRGYRFLRGHWSLPMILSAFEPSDVVCVLREPRTRLLSQYTYWRSWNDDQHASWAPFEASLLARRSLGEFARNSSAASVIDNLASRLILGHHPRIPSSGIIEADDVQRVAADAIDALDRLGYVDVVERGESLYTDLEAWFGSPLVRVRLNETDVTKGMAIDLDDLLDPQTLAEVSARCAVDLIVWQHVVETRGMTPLDAAALGDATYGTALVRLATRARAATPSAASTDDLRRTTRLRTAAGRLHRLVERFRVWWGERRNVPHR